MYLGHGLDLSRSRDVISQVIIIHEAAITTLTIQQFLAVQV